jgi:hypothetical protein
MGRGEPLSSIEACEQWCGEGAYLSGASDHKESEARRVERGQREGDALQRRLGRIGNGLDICVGGTQQSVAFKERGGVPVRAHPQDDRVEDGRSNARCRRAAARDAREHGRVCGGGLRQGEGMVEAKDLGGLDVGLLEERLLPLACGRMVGSRGGESEEVGQGW